MCGIVGYVGNSPAQNTLLEGLRRLEYRGYDSAGVALVHGGQIVLARKVGKIRELEEALATNPCPAALGIGHTRWDTHGLPTVENAHPHTDCSGKLALVHNGIIENHRELKDALRASGHRFVSDTDTEVLVHLVEEHYKGDLLSAVQKAFACAEGALAIAVVHADHPDEIVAARWGSPLVVGLLPGAGFLASDAPALLPYTRDFLFLDEGDTVRVRPGQVEVWNRDGHPKEAQFVRVPWDDAVAQKGGHRHYMHKEIHEQPQAVADTLRDQLHAEWNGRLAEELRSVDHIYLVACGTSYHAAVAAEYLWEPVLQVPVTAEIASEFQFKGAALNARTLVVAVSQSGETADTLGAVREAKARGSRVLGVVNKLGSALEREAHGVIYTRAGLEIAVAATKTFTAQVAALTLLGLRLARIRGNLSDEGFAAASQELARAPQILTQALKTEEALVALAQKFQGKPDFLYLARGLLFPLALEGALKLKEISYIHAEAYPAAEMKHGPIALIHEDMPVLFLFSGQELPHKTLANIQEVKARNGIRIVLSDQDDPELRDLADHLILVPNVPRPLLPYAFTPPLQLLAYHIACLRGTDVDQPRNLAKTVTVP